MKMCPKCKIEKHETEFYFKTKQHTERHSWCKQCSNQHNNEFRKKYPNRARNWDKIKYQKSREERITAAQRYRQNHPERTRETHLKSKYGITTEIYQQLLEEQNFSCAICKKHVNDNHRVFVVDHDHTTLNIRGLLCDGCNRGVGFYELYKDYYERYLISNLQTKGRIYRIPKPIKIYPKKSKTK